MMRIERLYGKKNWNFIVEIVVVEIGEAEMRSGLIQSVPGLKEIVKWNSRSRETEDSSFHG